MKASKQSQTKNNQMAQNAKLRLDKELQEWKIQQEKLTVLCQSIHDKVFYLISKHVEFGKKFKNNKILWNSKRRKGNLLCFK
jgi:hypothetical protein